jgi:hypothetical protein
MAVAGLLVTVVGAVVGSAIGSAVGACAQPANPTSSTRIMSEIIFVVLLFIG